MLDWQQINFASSPHANPATVDFWIVG